MDNHTSFQNSIVKTVNKELAIPWDPETADNEKRHAFEQYRECYLRELLMLVEVVLMKPFSIEARTLRWESIISTVWPETFCRLKREHLGHETASHCDCESTKEEWRVNMSWSKRKNEAQAILDDLEAKFGQAGSVVGFWWQPGYGEDEDWEPTRRAQVVYDQYERRNDFPLHQMTFVNFLEKEHDRRYQKLRQMAEGCRESLIRMGEARSQKHPEGLYWRRNRQIRWMGIDDWESSLNRRMEFLDWMYRFLALDPGLNEELMRWLAIPLLAMLNPWPNPDVLDHPSHQLGHTLDPDLPALDALQECIWWVEWLWPLEGPVVAQDNYRESIRASNSMNDVMQRNRLIEWSDMQLRNYQADRKTLLYAVTPEAAIAKGDTTCTMCQEDWNQHPNHEPVLLPCCNKFVGRRCLKLFLACTPIRPAGEERYLTEGKWAEEFKCCLCRMSIGDHFSPNAFEQGNTHVIKDIRHFNFHDRLENHSLEDTHWHRRREQLRSEQELRERQEQQQQQQ
ncbi:hypothetical protein ColKHC_08114 [Colletotrichum higginsianum]|nr:hypothetical protein ColKHC_08114 [Colletotrichum higginsianum]